MLASTDTNVLSPDMASLFLKQKPDLQVRRNVVRAVLRDSNLFDASLTFRSALVLTVG